jgi:diaminohydroxyphosphoribosylaminopyrimidine deaminase / 5-amino-6-(5-phosphoribosylamino)uracil reductase
MTPACTRCQMHVAAAVAAKTAQLFLSDIETDFPLDRMNTYRRVPRAVRRRLYSWVPMAQDQSQDQSTGRFRVEPHLALARMANALAFLCAPSPSAYSVGAVVADPNGLVLGTGYSRQMGQHDHAEEVALRCAKPHRHDLRGTFLYTSLEPCGARNSKPSCCAQLLIEAGISRVYFTAREPSLFQRPNGLALLRSAGVHCVELPNFDDYFRKANAHLFRADPADGIRDRRRLACSPRTNSAEQSQ